MVNLTAVIVTLNEEENIRGCLKSVDFADEIIVVDSESQDRTAEIAVSKNAMVIETKIKYPERKKNIGIEKAKHTWILVVDADERITSKLKKEIEDVLKNPEYNGYWIYRRNFFLGREIKHCGWERDKVIRLFKKDAGKYLDKRVHGKIEINGTVGVLKNKMEHHSYKSINDYFIKVNRYTAWSALDLEGEKINPCKLFINPLMRFIKMYILKKGFLDGVQGFALCVMAAFSVFIKYLRIYLNES